MQNITILITCKNCEKDFSVEVSPIVRVKFSVENCYREGGELEPDECPHCSASVDEADAYYLYYEAIHDIQADYADRKREEDR